MTKTKTLHIRFQAFSDFKKVGIRALSGAPPAIQENDELIFASPKVFEKFLTTQRIHLLAAIRCFQPKSIYHLAQILDRDFGNVSRDCTALEGHGFIKLKPTSVRDSKKPCLIFDYEVIKVHIPGPNKLAFSHIIAA